MKCPLCGKEFYEEKLRNDPCPHTAQDFIKEIERLKMVIDDALECMHNMDHEKAFKILGGKP